MNVQPAASHSQIISSNPELPSHLNINIEIIDTTAKKVIPDRSSVNRGTIAKIRIGNRNNCPFRIVTHVVPKSKENIRDTRNELLATTVDLEGKKQVELNQFAINESLIIYVATAQLPLITGRPLMSAQFSVIVV